MLTRPKLLTLTVVLLALLPVTAYAQLQVLFNVQVTASITVHTDPSLDSPLVGYLKPGMPARVFACNVDCSWLSIGPSVWIQSSGVVAVSSLPAGIVLPATSLTPLLTPLATALPTSVAAAIVPPPPATPIPPPATPPAQTPPPTTTPMNVVLQGINFDGAVPEVESDEYAVITNLGTTSQNLSGWRLHADDAGQDFTFPSFDLLPGQSCRVYTNEAHPEYCGFSYGRGSAIWNNINADCGHLYNASGAEVSKYCYAVGS